MDNLLTILIFLAVGVLFVLFNMTVGKLFRPRVPLADKGTAYECGEEPLGPSWVQFDLRFYIIALLFLVFDVEVALLYPWAAVYRQIQLPALIAALVFFGILLIGFAYLWRFGYLEWVRSAVTRGLANTADERTKSTATLQELARKDPELKPAEYREGEGTPAGGPS
ncbi:MAG TPA: NADH-quinone oxidoreductase subunit A [Phycisphaerae bacterium]|jgi:NADH-quinone oxidoreductase subunit A|nr:NADH-quinone oxidoreductase subunit A [Phycisphaerae bacterium]